MSDIAVNGHTIDFRAINNAALARARSLLPQIIPGGTFRSLEYVVRNPSRNDQHPGSFKINYRSGAWGDFATDDKGGDLVSLVAYVRGVNQGEAARQLADMVGIPVPTPKAAAGGNGTAGDGELTSVEPLPLHPELVAAGCAIALASSDQKLVAIERQAIRLGSHVNSGAIPRGDVVEYLTEIASAHGLLNRATGREDVENVIRMGLNGAESLTSFEREEAPSSPPPPLARELTVTNAADVVILPVSWLWSGRFALGKLSLIAGEPGLGKSQLTAAVTAAVTTGTEWPCDGEPAPLGSVVILSAEDDASDTIVPRLKAAGADLARVHIVSAVKDVRDGNRVERSFNLQADLDLLEQTTRGLGDVRLIIIDPITSYLGKVDSHRNAEIRSVLEPVAQMAAQRGAAVIGITHFAKGGGTTAINRFIGSIGFIAAARAAFVVTRDPNSDDDARRLFVPVKNNLAPLGDGLSFRIEQRMLGDSGIIASLVVWGSDPVTQTADEILRANDDANGGGGGESPIAEAEAFLLEFLANGARPSGEIKAAALDGAISWRTANRAKKNLGVKAESRSDLAMPGDKRPPKVRWWWSLSGTSTAPKDANSPQGCQVLEVASLGEVGILGQSGREK